MPFVTSYVNTILTNLFSGSAIGLSTTTPLASGQGFSEPSPSTGYKRAGASQGNFSANNKNIKNQDYIYFDEIVTDAGTVTHMGVFKNNELCYFGALTTPKALTPASADEGVVPLFRPESISITIDDSE